MASSSSSGCPPKPQEKIYIPPELLLLSVLENLDEESFKHFKDRLSEITFDPCLPIPQGELENADRATIRDRLLEVHKNYTQYYLPLELTMQVLRSINLPEPADKIYSYLEEHDHDYKYLDDADTEPAARPLSDTLKACRAEYMDFIKAKYQNYEDGHTRMGKNGHSKARFPRLLRFFPFRQYRKNIKEIVLQSRKTVIFEYSAKFLYHFKPSTIWGLFDPYYSMPKTVVLWGPSGIGKTMTSQKILLEWACGNFYPNRFYFVFYLSCRELNTITGNISLARLIEKTCPLKSIQDHLWSIFSHDKNVLFLIDGFDELKLTLKTDKKRFFDPSMEITKETTVSNMMTWILSYEPLSLLITARKESVQEQGICGSFHCVELLGFTNDDREDYVYHFFDTKQQAELAINVIKSNDTLFTWCAAPLVLWMVCTIIKCQRLEGSLVCLKTMTSLYLLFTESIINYDTKFSNSSVKVIMKKLCALANEGIWNQQFLFGQDDLERHKLSASELKSLFLIQNLFCKDHGDPACYSFLHLSIQEFFAALYYVTPSLMDHAFCSGVREIRNLLDSLPNKPHLWSMIQFLCGLLNEKQTQKTGKGIGIGYKVPLFVKPVLERWLREPLDDSMSLKFDFLYETQDEDLVKRSMSHFLTLVINGIHPLYRCEAMYRTLSYCLMKTESEHEISFTDCSFDPKTQTLLSSALTKCSKLLFYACSFRDNDVLSFDDPEDPNMSILLKSLYRIKDLEFRNCLLSSPCCKDLRDVMIRSSSLHRLYLYCNNLDGSGLDLLCEGLQHPDCNLQELSLTRSILQVARGIGEQLRTLVASSKSLKVLNLIYWPAYDDNVKLLFEGLRSPECTLQELRVDWLDLRSSSLSNDCLRSVIVTNRSLKTLDLENSSLSDRVIRSLTEGLLHPDCVLQNLSLSRCGLPSSCMDDLCSIIINNRSLITLDLSYNHLDGNLLEKAFWHRDCTLQELKMEGINQNCNLTRQSSKRKSGRTKSPFCLP